MTAVGKAAPRRRNRRGRGEDLRGEIVAATKQLLADSADSDAVSIRAVAEAVNVTPPSIYLHFADKDQLLEAVVVDVFAELDTAMMASAASADSPLGRLRAFGLAYVRFAVEHPEHYRLAAMERCPEGPTGAISLMDKVLADGAFTHFMDTVRDCMAAGIFAEGDPMPVTLQLWAAAHGIASLMIAKPFLPWGDIEQAADAVLGAAALGRATADLIGGEVDPTRVASWLAEQRDH